MYNFPTNQDHLSLLIVCFLISFQYNGMLLMLCPLHNSFIYSNVNVTIHILRAAEISCLFCQPAFVRSNYLHKTPEEVTVVCTGTPRYPWTYLARAARLRSVGSCSYGLQLLTCIGATVPPEAPSPQQALKACVSEPAEAAITLWQPSYTSAFPIASML